MPNCFRFLWLVCGLILGVLPLAGCGHKPVQPSLQVEAPPPPPVSPQATRPQATNSQATSTVASSIADLDSQRLKNVAPIFIEEGLASWYGPPYHNRRGANGRVYDMNAATAAHRTLPMNSLVRVINLATGKSVIVRITDRGPFIVGRVIDLSLAAAKTIDVWGPGVTQVRLEVLEAPAPIDRGGRWCVQIGAFTSVKDADRLKQKLAHRYRTAQVLEFAGPTGEWIRVRVLNDEKSRAEALLRDTHAGQGAAFLVRLD